MICANRQNVIYLLAEDVLGMIQPSPNLEDLLTDKVDKAKEKEEENKLSPKISIMKPILRFLQLLCENHNSYLQNLLRDQDNKTKYNLVSETLILLDVICGSTTGGLGLLGLYINESNVFLINQILEALTEYCQVGLKSIRYLHRFGCRHINIAFKILFVSYSFYTLCFSLHF